MPGQSRLYNVFPLIYGTRFAWNVSPIHATRAPGHGRKPTRALEWGPRRAHLQVGEELAAALQDGVHAVSHGDRVLPVVVRDPPVVLLHGHNETTQLFKLKAVRKEMRTETGRVSRL